MQVAFLDPLIDTFINIEEKKVQQNSCENAADRKTFVMTNEGDSYELRDKALKIPATSLPSMTIIIERVIVKENKRKTTG